MAERAQNGITAAGGRAPATTGSQSVRNVRKSSRGVVSPEGIDNGKARPQADAVLLMTSGIDRSARNEEW